MRSGVIRLATGLLLGVGLLRTCFMPVITSGSCMEPGLPSPTVLMMKRCWLTKELKRFDIVVARANGELILKRIVGLPGEWIEMADGTVRINGKDLAEDHVANKGHWTVGQAYLAADRYLIMGDNREGVEPTFFIVRTADVVAWKR